MDAVDRRPGPLRRFRVAHERDVLDALRTRGPLTRHELQAITGLSRTTLHDIVSGLREQGAVSERRSAAGGVGRPSARLALEERAAYIVGVEIGRRHIGLAVANLAHEIVHSSDAPLDGSAGGRRVGEVAVTALRDALEREGLGNGRLQSIVIGVPLSLGDGDDPEALRADVTAAFADAYGVAPLFENNARLVALAESRWGAAQDAEDVLYVHLDVGVGGALILGRSLVDGPSGHAGEVGHVSQDAAGPRCWCGGRGCLERYLALPEVLDAAGVSTPGEVSEAAIHGILASRIDKLARTIGGVLTALDLRIVVLGGAMAGIDGLAEATASVLRTTLPSRLSAEVQVRTAELGALGSARGALARGLASAGGD